MTDWPVEQAQADSNLDVITHGRVLVGGLGLGLCATILARRRGISHVTVVENSPDVVKLVAKHLRVPHGKLRIIEADLFEYLEETQTAPPYDWAFYDIWASDSMETLLSTVVPLRQATVDNNWVAFGDRIKCWNEDVMRGQVHMGLFTRLQFALRDDALRKHMKGLAQPTIEEMAEKQGNKWWDMYSPFWAWMRDNRPEEERAMRAAMVYSVVFGQPGWESRWEETAKTL